MPAGVPRSAGLFGYRNPVLAEFSDYHAVAYKRG
jgi:hypothetical protein